MTARYVVGIDLGTTNTVVAYTDLEDERAVRRREATVFSVTQRIAPGENEPRPLLPSALFAPPNAEREEGDRSWLVGAFARQRGSEVPSRAVTSAKSWLAHPSVDRTAAILPWGLGDEDALSPRISPVEASARILAHLRDAWDRAHAQDAKGGAPLAEQDVILTVPASFDEAARAYTIEATKQAGLRVKLLEEPQAAFLDWARIVGDEGLRAIASAGGREVLVCDVGGGTTDFSLLRVARAESDPSGVKVERVAVGDHLLLGGDNVDLAIAHLLEPRLATAGEERLSPARFAQLVSIARGAKEQLLARGAELTEVPVTLLGGGSKLVGGARKTMLARAELDAILDGFFPPVSRDARAQRARGGLIAFGLPYASDPAITRHLAGFLARHAMSVSEHRELALLLNGGAFHAHAIVERVTRAVASLTAATPRVLEQGDPDLSVARGAVTHGLALRGHGLRIGGGSSRSYWIGLDSVDGTRRAVCVVPRGAEPGERQIVGNRAFALTLGRTARFDLFASTGQIGRVDHVGDVATISDDDEFVLLPPIVTAVSSREAGEIPVRLEGALTEVGTLELECVEVDAGGSTPPNTRRRRFHLGFELRKEAGPESLRRRTARVPEDRRLAEAREKVDRAFADGSEPRDARNLMRELERILGERSGWATTTVRPLFDALRPHIALRRRSVDHERVFWQLAGFLLRPGYGDPLDALRMRAMVPLWEQRLTHPNEPNGWRAFWIAWRRIAGGLEEPTQSRVRDTLDPFLCMNGAYEQGPDARPRKKPKGVRGEPFDEVLYLASSLERVPVPRRSELGVWILERTWTSQDASLYSALGRIGARLPAYASAHHVIPPRTAEHWLSQVLRADWAAIPTAPFAAVQLARRTGDRTRDVSDAARAEAVERLERTHARPEWIRLVREVVEVDEAQRGEMLGEALPPGLRLVED